MSDLAAYHGGGLSRRDARMVRRERRAQETYAALAMVRIDTEVDLQAARVQGVGYVGQQALQAVAMVSQMETQLAQMVPAAAGRLHGIADMTALSMAQIVSDTVRRVSR